MDIEKTCCFTGHRNFELTARAARQLLSPYIIEAITAKGYAHFIAGGAVGFDMVAAETVIELKRKYNITLEIAVPFPAHERMWDTQQKSRQLNIIKGADKQTEVCPRYHMSCYQQRNIYMVDNSSLVFAYFCGTSGGTKNTVHYANAKGVKVINIYKKPI